MRSQLQEQVGSCVGALLLLSRPASKMVAAGTVTAFSVPTSLVSALPSAVPAAAKAISLVPGGIVLGALSERLALRKSPLPAPAWGAAVRATAGSIAVRSLYLWSGMGGLETTAAAVAAAASSGTTTIQLGTDALATILTFAVWVGCLATGTKLGSVLQPVGITGGIACGKSTVAELLSSEQQQQEDKKDAGGGDSGSDSNSSSKGKPSFAIIDVDKIGHDILIPGKLVSSESAYENVVSEFGTDILSFSSPTSDEKRADGGDDRKRIERRKLGDVIFRDPSKRRTLNKLTHPLISKIMLKRVVTWNLFRKKNKTTNKLVAVDIPLLFEVGLKMRILFGLIVVVACKPSTQLTRLMERNKDLTQEQCQNRIDSQMPVTDKVSKADVVIWNDGTMEELMAELEKARREVADRVWGWRVTVPRVVLLLGTSGVVKVLAAATGLV